jgi:hypothetical protein
MSEHRAISERNRHAGTRMFVPRRPGLLLGITTLFLALAGTTQAIGETLFTEDFNDANISGWTASYNSSAAAPLSFPSYADRGSVLRFTGQTLVLTRDSFTLPNVDFDVQFDARLISHGLNSDHVAWIQYFDPNDSIQVSRRNGTYNDFYVWGPQFNRQYFRTNSSTSIYHWTTYRTQRRGDTYTFSFLDPGSTTWRDFSTWTAPAGTSTSGGQFQLYGASGAEVTWEFDNVTVAAVPLPAAVWAGLSMFAGMGGYKLVRRGVRRH